LTLPITSNSQTAAQHGPTEYPAEIRSRGLRSMSVPSAVRLPLTEIPARACRADDARATPRTPTWRDALLADMKPVQYRLEEGHRIIAARRRRGVV